MRGDLCVFFGVCVCVFGLKVCVFFHWFDFPNLLCLNCVCVCLDKVDPRKASKISPTYPWKIPQMFHPQFMKDFSFFFLGGIFPG